MIRLVATDLDGTLLRSDNTVSDRTRAALKAADAAGLVVVFVTGRPPRWLDAVVDVLPSAALGNALRTALTTGAVDVGPLLVLLVWTVVASIAAARWFRWD